MIMKLFVTFTVLVYSGSRNPNVATVEAANRHYED